MASYTVPAGRYGDYSTAFIQAYIDQKIADVIDQSPEALDSLNELAAAIGDDPAFFTTMATANTTLQTNIDNLTAAASAARVALQTLLQGNIDGVATDLTTETTARGVAIASESTARTNADTALSGRLDTLEADPTTAAALTAANATHAAARTALQTLLQNAIDAVQTDVNTNESDADTAIAAEATARAAAITALQTDVDANEAERKTYFKWDSNLTKVINPLRSSKIEIGNNIQIDPATGYATQFDGNVEFDGNTVLSHGGTDLTATFTELNTVGDLGTFSGSTIADNADVKAALQALETAVEGAAASDTELTELATMLNATAVALADLSAAEVAILDGATVTTDELNLLDGVTATTAELNYVDGVTSNIQTQLNAIQADVDTNESDADTAIASLSTNLNNEGAARLLADNANETHIDNLATLSGVAKDEQHLSTFSGSTISDDQTIKQALQALETAVETKQATDAELTELATMASTTAAALADLTEAEVQILDGATVTTTELNLLDGVTATTAELNYVDGVTANVQTQLNAKAPTANATMTGTTSLAAVTFSGGLSDYANDTDAAAGGIPVGGLYRHNSDVKIRVS